MQLHWAWTAIAAIALGTGLAWWFQPRDDLHARGPGASAADARGPGRHENSHGDKAPTLYRWVDDKGVVNITDRAPHGRPWTIVRIDPDRNIVHLSELISAARTASKPAPSAH